MIPFWFNCGPSWPHGGVHLSKHLDYLECHVPQGQHCGVLANQMNEVGRYLRRLWMSFAIAFIHRDLLATHLSDGLWVRRLISWTVRTVHHPLLLLSRFEYFISPPWDKKWLTLGILEWLPERNWLWELPFSRFPYHVVNPIIQAGSERLVWYEHRSKDLMIVLTNHTVIF